MQIIIIQFLYIYILMCDVKRKGIDAFTSSHILHHSGNLHLHYGFLTAGLSQVYFLYLSKRVMTQETSHSKNGFVPLPLPQPTFSFSQSERIKTKLI